MRPLLLIVCVAVASAGQNPPAATDAQKLKPHGSSSARGTLATTPSPRRTASTKPSTSRSAASSSGSRFVEKTGTTRCCSSSWRTGRCDQPLGLRRVQVVAQALHHRPMGSTRRRENIRQEPRRAARGHHHRARMTQDGVELADVLRKQLRKDKIVLVGHSRDRSSASTW